MSDNKKKNYLNNKDLLDEIIRCQENEEMSDRLGQMFLLLSQKISTSKNFNQYPYKEDLISAGVLACCNAYKKFDPNKSSNPFAFYSTVVHHAFLQVIKKEYKQKDVKDSVLVENNYNPSFGYEERVKEAEAEKKVEDEENNVSE